MAAGDAIGCFGLTEPDHGSDPASMTTRARRDGDDWVLTAARCGSPTRRSPTWRWSGPGPTEGVVGFVVPMDTPGVTAREITHKMSLRASSTGEIVLDDVRLPATPGCPRRAGLKAPLSLPDRGPVRHRLGRARGGPRLPATPRSTTPSRRSSSAGRSPASSSPRPSSPTWRSSCRRASCWRCTWAGAPTPESCARAGQRRQAQQRAGGAGDRPPVPHDPGRQRDQR